MQFNVKTGKPQTNFTFYAIIIVLFTVVQITEDVLQHVVKSPWMVTTLKLPGDRSDALLEGAPLFKCIVFVLCVSILSFPFIRDLYKNLGTIKLCRLGLSFVGGLGTAIILGFLAFCIGEDGMGTNYARISERPFNQGTTEYSTRLLMPVIAYILHLRGFWLYYLFFIILTIIFIALLLGWNDTNTHLNFFQFVSLCTSSFVIFQFETPGYPDILVFIFFILVMCCRFNSSAKLSLLILALIAHESSILIGLVLAWRYLEKDDVFTYVVTVILYGVVWFIASGFSVNPILAAHTIEGRPVIAWILQSPLQGIIGLLISFKALWILLGFGAVLAFRQKLFADTGFIVGCIIASLVMTLLGADTSRLMGYAFPGLLVAIGTIKSMPGKMNKNIFSLIFLINLCIPSFNSVISSGIFLAPGLYEIIYHWLGSLV